VESETRRRSIAFIKHLTNNFYKEEDDSFKGKDLLKMVETPSEDLLNTLQSEGLCDTPWVDHFRE